MQDSQQSGVRGLQAIRTYSEDRFDPSVMRLKWLLTVLPVLDVGLVTASDLVPFPEFDGLASVALLVLLEPLALLAL